MKNISEIKNKLVEELWLPITNKGGDLFFSRLRRNKQMKMLTLTSHENLQEVKEFTKERLTTKNRIYGWNKSHTMRWRIECEGLMDNVFGNTKYEDSIPIGAGEVINLFPFNILNLDFSSQNPIREIGRLENEFSGVEHSLKLQKSAGSPNMVLIYTTLLNSELFNIPAIKEKSDNVKISDWTGLSIDSLPNSTIDHDEKKDFLINLLEQVCGKYKFSKLDSFNIMFEKIGDKNEYVLSIASLLNKE